MNFLYEPEMKTLLGKIYIFLIYSKTLKTKMKSKIYNLLKQPLKGVGKTQLKHGFNPYFYSLIKKLTLLISRGSGFEFYYSSKKDIEHINNFFTIDKNKPIRLLTGDVQIGKTNAICLYILEARLRGFLPSFVTSKSTELADQFIKTDVESFNHDILREIIDRYLVNQISRSCERNSNFKQYFDQFELDNFQNSEQFKDIVFNLLRIRPFRFKGKKKFKPSTNFQSWCEVPVFLIENNNFRMAVGLVHRLSRIQHLEPAFLIDEFHGTITEMEGKCSFDSDKNVNLSGTTFIQYLMNRVSSNGIIIGISATHLRSYIHPVIGNSIKMSRPIEGCSFYTNKGLVYRGKNSINDGLAVFHPFEFQMDGLKKDLQKSSTIAKEGLVDLIKQIVDEDFNPEYQKIILMNVFYKNSDQTEFANEYLRGRLENNINTFICNQDLTDSIGHYIDQYDDDKPLVIVAGHKCKEGNRFKPTTHTKGRFAGITHYIYLPSEKPHAEAVTQHQRWMGQYKHDFPATQIYSTDSGLSIIKQSCDIITTYNEQYNVREGRKSVEQVFLPFEKKLVKPILNVNNSSSSKFIEFKNFDDLINYMDTKGIEAYEHSSQIIQIPLSEFHSKGIDPLTDTNQITGKTESSLIKRIIIKFLKNNGYGDSTRCQFTWKNKTRYESLLNAVLNPGPGITWEVQYLAPKNLKFDGEFVNIVWFHNYFKINDQHPEGYFYFRTPDNNWVLNYSGITFHLPENKSYMFLEHNHDIYKLIDKIFGELDEQLSKKSTHQVDSYRFITSLFKKTNHHILGQTEPFTPTIKGLQSYLNRKNGKSEINNLIRDLELENCTFDNLLDFKKYMFDTGLSHQTISSLFAHIIKNDVKLLELVSRYT